MHMIKRLALIAGIALTSGINAQDIDDIVSVGEGYANESYYSMNNGEVANVSNVNWDIAFDVSPIEINQTTFEVKGYSIRINPATNTRLKLYPNGTVADWMNIDTTGIASWPNLFNPEDTWSKGAFDVNLNGSDVFDFGWGVYSPVTHVLTGDSLFILQLGDGSYKKVWLEKMELEEYYFKHANLDGTDEVSQSIAKADYSDRNYVYYSITNDQVINREPETGSWDIVFTRYVSEIIPDFFLTVTGAFSNKGIEVAQANGVEDPFEYEDFESQSFETDINVIGYDWKSFNETTFQWSIVDELCYFIKDNSSNIWRLTFSFFGGSSSGEIAFNKELIAALDVNELQPITGLNLFPNPANDQFTLLFDNKSNESRIEIIDISGKLVYGDQFLGSGLNVHTLDASQFESGIYLLNIISQDQRQSKKLIIQ